jgi:hypothetical protein
MTFLYVVWLFYQSAWQSDQMNYVYWAPAGLIVGLSYRMEAERALTAARKGTDEARRAVTSGVPSEQARHG